MNDAAQASQLEARFQDDPLLTDLTQAQRQAVLETEGPVLILAAAGSGKTRVITRRIGRLITQGIPPWAILSLTFTNKAAGEMRERVAALPGLEGRSFRGLTVTTFHSLCARLLRKYADDDAVRRRGIAPDFVIFDTDDQISLLKKATESLGIATSNFPPRSVLSAISNAKNELLDANAFAQRANDFYSRTVARLYQGYERAMREAHAADFDDLLLVTAGALRDSQTMRDDCRRRWNYIQIDEYQDTNRAQFVIASMLAGEPGEKPNICVVGDPDQSIYGWRGADIRNILDFEAHYPGARVITLGQNFRSTAPILAVADSLIRHNAQRKHKDLFTTRPGGEKVEVVRLSDERHEADFVRSWLTDRHEDGVPWSSMAVLYRNNALSRVVEDALRRASIPYVIARGTAYFQREEVRHAVAYLRVVANPADNVSLERIINTPARGIGKTTFAVVEQAAAASGVPTYEAIRGARGDASLTARAAKSLDAFVQMIESWRGGGLLVTRETGLAELVDRVVRESGLDAMYREQAAKSGADGDAERLANLAELVSSAAQFEEEFDEAGDPASAAFDPFAETPPEPPSTLSVLRAYLESVSLVADADAIDPASGAVTLMTLHAAKGLEFDSAVIIGLEHGLLPSSRSVGSDAQLEEERRLCFVGMTRAMRRLLLTSAQYRTVRGIVERSVESPFLDEIDPKNSERTDRTLGYDDRGAQTPSRGTPDPRFGGLRVGAMVKHPQFGMGRVLGLDAGAQPRARVEFRFAGTKTLLLEYARLELIGRAD